MISAASLSAFSFGPSPVGQPGTGLVQPVRAPGGPPPVAASSETAPRQNPSGSGAGGGSTTPPPRSLPRGSLIDLSV